MNRFHLAVLGTALLLTGPAAFAQSIGENGEAFIRAVRDRNGEKAEELLRDAGSTLVNARSVNGDTGLLIAVARRDPTWTGFLLNNGADPNVANRNTGDTPMIVAARIGFLQGAEWLVSKKARVDEPNRMGETPLIVAVQARHTPLVKYLLGKGADPDRADSAAGYSARDYAKRDTRNPEMLRLIEAAKTPAKTN